LTVIAWDTAENGHYLAIRVTAAAVAKKGLPTEKKQTDNVKEGLSR